MSTENIVADHYTHGSLEAAITTALVAAGKDPEKLHPDDLAPIDEFHIGGRAATAEFANELGATRGAHLLDIGSGLGGPSRYFAHALGCHVTGLDLTPEYVRVAENLSRRCGLEARGYRLSSTVGGACRDEFRRDAGDLLPLARSRRVRR